MLSNEEIANIKQKFVLNLKSIEVKEIKPEELAKICPFYSAILIGGGKL